MGIYFTLCVLTPVYSVWFLTSFQLGPRQVPRLTRSERDTEGAVWWLQMTSGEPVDLGSKEKRRECSDVGGSGPGRGRSEQGSWRGVQVQLHRQEDAGWESWMADGKLEVQVSCHENGRGPRSFLSRDATAQSRLQPTADPRCDGRWTETAQQPPVQMRGGVWFMLCPQRRDKGLACG